MERIQEEHITTSEELCKSIHERTLFCGEMRPETAFLIKSILGEKAIVVTGAGSIRRAAFVAELGWRRLERGEVDDPVTLQPLYLRRPHITVPKKGKE